MTIKINKMNVLLLAESQLTERSQTAIPDALHLKPGEDIKYAVLAGGKAILSRQGEQLDDQVLSQFLTFIDNDIEKNPENIYPVPVEWWESIKVLTAGVEIDLDASLIDD